MFTRFSSKKHRARKTKNTPEARQENGFSLIATLAMSTAIGLFLIGMYQGLLPIYFKIVNMRYGDVMRSVNEAALDYTLGQINTGTISLSSLSYGQSETLSGSSYFPSTITSEGLATMNPSVTITNVGTYGNGGPPTNSVLYSNTYPSNADFYTVVSTVKYAGVTKTLTVVFQPLLTVNNGTSSTTGSTTYTVTAAGGAPGGFALCAQNNVELFGKAAVNGYNLPSGWTNPYQFADTMCNTSVTWQIGDNNNARGVLQGGSIFEFWSPSNPNPPLPSGTSLEANEDWMSIMGNVYSNYYDQYADQMGYMTRSQSNDTGATEDYANVYGAANGLVLNGSGVPSGYPTTSGSGGSASSIPIPQWSNTASQLANTSYSNWGNPGNYPTAGSSTGGTSFTSNPNTGGYITSPGAGGQADPSDTSSTTNSTATIKWDYPEAPSSYFVAPSAPTGTPTNAANGAAGTGSYYSGSNAPNLVVEGTLQITNAVTSPPTSFTGTVAPNTTVQIPPANYNFSSIQVLSGSTTSGSGWHQTSTPYTGQITIDQNISGPTQFFVNPTGGSAGQGTASAVYFANGTSANMSGIATPSGADTTDFTIGNGLNMNGLPGFGATQNSSNTSSQGGTASGGQLTVDTAHPISDSSGYSSQNLVINSNSVCNMLFAGNAQCIVNAPNANVNVGYQPGNQSYSTNGYDDPSSAMSSDANFFGAIVAGNTTVCSDWSSGGGAYMHYDVSLKGSTPTFVDPWLFFNGLTSTSSSSSSSNSSSTVQVSGYRAVTWQEQLTSDY